MSAGTALAAQEAKLVRMSGNVEVMESAGSWQPAVLGMDLPEGMNIKTGVNGRALIRLPDKARIWLKESSRFEIENKRPLLRRISLLWGAIKVKIPHLRRNRRFEVKTMTAVAGKTNNKILSAFLIADNILKGRRGAMQFFNF